MRWNLHVSADKVAVGEWFTFYEGGTVYLKTEEVTVNGALANCLVPDTGIMYRVERSMDVRLLHTVITIPGKYTSYETLKVGDCFTCFEDTVPYMKTEEVIVDGVMRNCVYLPGGKWAIIDHKAGPVLVKREVAIEY